jgi:hypothetical protein
MKFVCQYCRRKYQLELVEGPSGKINIAIHCLECPGKPQLIITN